MGVHPFTLAGAVHISADCELKSSSRKGVLGTMFGRTGLLKRNTGRQRCQGLSYIVSRNSTKNHVKMKETSAVCLNNEHKD